MKNEAREKAVELLPCPFCGSAAKEVEYEFAINSHYISCSVCKGGIGYCDEPEDAVRMWNTRFDAGVQHATQWVRVSDALPDFDGDYLCQVEIPQECGNVWKRQRVVATANAVWLSGSGYSVTHWMPLPPPCDPAEVKI